MNGKYANDQFVLSFIGFAPAEDPRIALIVIVDDPKIDSYVQGTPVVRPYLERSWRKACDISGLKVRRMHRM